MTKSRDTRYNQSTAERHILIVDDDEDFAESLNGLLLMKGYKVTMANNYKDAIIAVKDFYAEVALIDVRLGTSNGIDLMSSLKKAIPEILCVIMTAYAGIENAITALQKGAYDYLRKPINAEDLFSTLNRCFERVQLEREKALTQLELKQRNVELEKTVKERDAQIFERVRAEQALIISEENYRTLYEDNPTMYFTVSKDGKVQSVNRFGCEQLGYSSVELIGKPVLNIFYEEDKNAVLKQMQKCLDEPNIQHSWELRKVHKNGRVIWVRETAKAITSKDGGTLVLIVCEDITDRKRSEVALFESEKKYRLIADNTADTIWSMDLNLTFTYISPSIYNFRGFTVEEAMSQSLEQMLTPDSLRLIYNLFDEEMRMEDTGGADTGRFRIFETQQYKKDGSIIWVENTVSFLRDENLKPVGILGISRDITDRKRAEKVQSAIYRISESAQTSASLDVLFSSIHNIIAELMPAKNFYIALYNSETETISFPYFADEVDSPPPLLKLNGGMTDYVLRTSKSLLSTPQVFKQLVQSGLVKPLGNEPVDWLGVPLKTQRGETIGVMAVQTYTEDIRLTAIDQNILEFVSTQVAMAIERKRAGEELKERMTRSELIAKMGQSTTAIMELNDLLNQTVNMIQKTFEYYNVLVFLKEGKRIILKATTLDFEKHLIGQANLEIGRQGIAGWVAGRGESLIVSDVRKDNRYYLEDETTKTLSELAVPIKLKGEIIGVLDAQSTVTNAFSQLDVFTLQTISDQLAIAIENARLYESTQIEIAERKRSENELKEYRLHLEDIINDRTKELEKVNKLLQEEIKKQKEAEEKVKKALEKEKELSELKSKFISIASHEFRTPLAVIYSSTELLQRYGRKWELKDYEEQISSIKSNVHHLTDIMDDVLTISRADVGKIQFEPQATNLVQLCNSILENVRLICSQFQIISFNYVPKTSTYLLDERLIKYILLNLLSNAVKYSKASCRIEFIVNSDEQNLIFEITDQGIGIPDEDQPFLFEPFHRGSNVGEIHGTGLGMSIVKRSVELHGGSIAFVSKSGEGTRFSVCIPKLSLKLTKG
ncbi:MAG: PAS domain S-box protein [bacterium]